MLKAVLMNYNLILGNPKRRIPKLNNGFFHQTKARDYPNEYLSLGQKIFSIRKSAKLSQDAFAKEVGALTRGTVNNWEKGRRKPNYNQMIKIAKFGNCSIDWLLDFQLNKVLK